MDAPSTSTDVAGAIAKKDAAQFVVAEKFLFFFPKILVEKLAMK